MLSKVYSAGLFGIDGFIVSVEVNGYPSLPHFELVGLPDLAVKEAKERVLQICGRRAFQAVGTARANSTRWEWAWYVGRRTERGRGSGRR